MSRQTFSAVPGGPFAGCLRSFFHVWLWGRAGELKASGWGDYGQNTLPQIEAGATPALPNTLLITEITDYLRKQNIRAVVTLLP